MEFYTEPARDVPVVDEVEVLVVGAGPAGCGAALAAARQGAKTLLVEQFNCVGGMATSGLMSNFSGSPQSPFVRELLDAMEQHAPGCAVDGCRPNGRAIRHEALKSVLLRKLVEAGVGLRLYTFACGAIMEGTRIKGIVCESKTGRQAILARVADFDPSALKFFTFTDGVSVGGIPAIVSRTGYTGEDGFEIYVPWERGAELWDLLLEAGKDAGLIPIGLGARDSLRFEAGLPLCGHEYTDILGPLEAGFGFFVKVDKPGGFIGQPVLKRQKEEGLRRKIVGLRLEDKGVPRAGMDVADPSGKMVGTVTSGGYCPSLDANMALCCVETPAPAEGESLSVVIRDRPKQGVVVKRPFYDRKYKK